MSDSTFTFSHSPPQALPAVADEASSGGAQEEPESDQVSAAGTYVTVEERVTRPSFLPSPTPSAAGPAARPADLPASLSEAERGKGERPSERRSSSAKGGRRSSEKGEGEQGGIVAAAALQGLEVSFLTSPSLAASAASPPSGAAGMVDRPNRVASGRQRDGGDPGERRSSVECSVSKPSAQKTNPPITVPPATRRKLPFRSKSMSLRRFSKSFSPSMPRSGVDDGKDAARSGRRLTPRPKPSAAGAAGRRRSDARPDAAGGGSATEVFSIYTPGSVTPAQSVNSDNGSPRRSRSRDKSPVAPAGLTAEEKLEFYLNQRRARPSSRPAPQVDKTSGAGQAAVPPNGSHQPPVAVTEAPVEGAASAAETAGSGRRSGTPSRRRVVANENVAMTPTNRKRELDEVSAASTFTPAGRALSAIVDAAAARESQYTAVVKRLKDVEGELSQETLHQRSLKLQYITHVKFVEDMSRASLNMTAEINTLKEQLSMEKATRAQEREGYQRMTGISQSQVSHLNDLNRAAERRIEELEDHFRRLCANAEAEHERVCGYAAQVEGEAKEYKELVIKREQAYIDLDGEATKLRSDLKLAQEDQARRSGELQSASVELQKLREANGRCAVAQEEERARRREAEVRVDQLRTEVARLRMDPPSPAVAGASVAGPIGSGGGGGGGGGDECRRRCEEAWASERLAREEIVRLREIIEHMRVGREAVEADAGRERDVLRQRVADKDRDLARLRNQVATLEDDVATVRRELADGPDSANITVRGTQTSLQCINASGPMTREAIILVMLAEHAGVVNDIGDIAKRIFEQDDEAIRLMLEDPAVFDQTVEEFSDIIADEARHVPPQEGEDEDDDDHADAGPGDGPVPHPCLNCPLHCPSADDRRKLAELRRENRKLSSKVDQYIETVDDLEDKLKSLQEELDEWEQWYDESLGQEEGEEEDDDAEGDDSDAGGAGGGDGEEVPPPPTPTGEERLTEEEREAAAADASGRSDPRAPGVKTEITVGGNTAGTSLESVVKSDGSVQVTHKIVEANKVTMPEWEGLAKIRFFAAEMVENLALAGGRTDRLERLWLMEVLAKGVKLEDFQKSWPLKDGTGDPSQKERMERLDRIFAVGMKALIKKHAKSEMFAIRRHEAKATWDGGDNYTGRQLFFIFIKSFKSRGELNHGTRVEQIHNIKYPGDAKMRIFYECWVSLIEDVDAQLPEETLRRLLREKLDSSDELAIDLAHFDRLDEENDDYSHKWLCQRMERCIQRKAEKKNDESYNDQIGKMFRAPVKNGAPAENAAGAEGGKGGGKRRRTRSRNRNRDKSGGGGGGGGGDPKAKAKAKAKGKAKAKAKAKAAPATPAEGGREQSRGRSKTYLKGVCYAFNHGGCQYSDEDCRFKHELVKKSEKDLIPRPRSVSAGGDPKGGGRGRGGKGKGKGNGKDRGRSPGGPKGGGKGKGKTDVKRGLYCKPFLQLGKCDREGCPYPHLNADQVNKLKEVYGENMNDFYQPNKGK